MISCWAKNNGASHQPLDKHALALTNILLQSWPSENPKPECICSFMGKGHSILRATKSWSHFLLHCQTPPFGGLDSLNVTYSRLNVHHFARLRQLLPVGLDRVQLMSECPLIAIAHAFIRERTLTFRRTVWAVEETSRSGGPQSQSGTWKGIFLGSRSSRSRKFFSTPLQNINCLTV